MNHRYLDKHDRLIEIILEECGQVWDASPEAIDILADRMHVSRRRIHHMLQALQLSGQLWPTVKTPHQRWVVLTEAVFSSASI